MSERIHKYEIWIRELETREKELTRRGPGLRRLFLGVLLVSPGGFLVSPWIGAGAVVTGLLVFAFGVYVLRIRRDEYASEIRLARAEVQRLRAGSARIHR